jgi:hypothetical protein
MSLDMVDTIWSVMQESEFYSPNDLANILGQPTSAVVRVLEFLAKYGFAQRVTKREMIFRRLHNKLSPGDALSVLRMLLEDVDAHDTGGIANVSKTSKRIGRLPQRGFG